MGVGICGAILFEFSMDGFRYKGDREEYFPKDFFANYNCDEDGGQRAFTLKPKSFLPHYGDMLKEFYDLIGEDLYGWPEIGRDEELLHIKSFKAFRNKFGGDARKGHIPCIFDYRGVISVLGCEASSAFVFYSGSYKAYLEEYDTFTHFERILRKAMKNPLRNIVKFGLLG